MDQQSSDLQAEADARLRELARVHRIDWEPLKRELMAAVEEQSQLEELAERHSCEIAGWESVVGDL